MREYAIELQDGAMLVDDTGRIVRREHFYHPKK